MKYFSEIEFSQVSNLPKYKDTISEVSQVSVTKNFPIVILNYEDAKRGLITAARNHAERIVNALLARHRKDCDSIISEFEEIKGVAEKNPEDTEELIKIQNYIIEIKGKRLQQIDLELEEMLKRMMYLLDVHLFRLVFKRRMLLRNNYVMILSIHNYYVIVT